MNRGLLGKAWRETWLTTLVLGAGLLLVETVLAYAMQRFQVQISHVLTQITIVERLVRAFLGADLARELGPGMLPAIAWAHPTVLALIWAHAITHCTRVPAGEVDRGTIDVLLGLPVSRGQLYVVETLVWLASGAMVVLAVAAGNTLGIALAHGTPVEAPRLVVLAVNLFCLYAAVGGVAWLMSALSNRRGRAAGLGFAFVLACFLLNYLSPFWSLAKQVSFLSLLHYYVPLGVLQSGAWPARDMGVLGGFTVVLWTAGGAIFARRDLATL